MYKDASQAIEKRVEDLLARMTVDEKCAQLGSYWVFELLENFQYSDAKIVALLQPGIGQITRIGGATSLLPRDAAELANRIQKFLVEQTRLSIPAMVHEECCSGLMTRGATLFPQAIGVASSWNPELTQKMTEVIRTQMKAIGAHQGLAPVLDVTRDPRWGRTEETLGEDPYLVAALGCAYVKGIQGEQLSSGVIATGKHFVGYGNSEGGLNWSPCHIPERELHEVFLFPFEAAVKEAGLGSIMNSYSELDGLPCCASKKLLREILRSSWKFDGIVVSDYFAINMLQEYHKVARDKHEAAIQALLAGIDVELPSTDCYGNPLKQALANGTVTMEEFDELVRNVLRMKFRLGLFEHPYIASENAPAVFETEEQRGLSRTLAAESIVLLKNDGVLPLHPDLNTIAVIGPNADSWRNMIGDYAYPCHIESLVEMAELGTFNIPVPKEAVLQAYQEIMQSLEIVTVLEAMRQRVSPQTQIRFAEGCDVTDPSKSGFPEAVTAAKNADVAVVVVGEKSGLTQGCTTGESRDRANLTLPGVQEDLIREICAAGTPVVLVLIHGRPYALETLQEQVKAIVAAWLPGEEGGNAIADVLFGQVNPGGKLPISFPRTVGQIPVFYAHRPSGGRSHWTGNYVDVSASPLYPFGHGLSYTTFVYEHLTISAPAIPQNGRVTISVDVRNTGARDGDEVVQLYVHYTPLHCPITRPVKELKGFKRISLKAGEKKRVTFTLQAHQLAFYQEDLRYAVNPGEVQVMIGSSSEDIRLAGAFRINGDAPQVVEKKVFFSQVDET